MLFKYIVLFSYSTYNSDILYSTSWNVTLKSYRAIFLSVIIYIDEIHNMAENVLIYIEIILKICSVRFQILVSWVLTPKSCFTQTEKNVLYTLIIGEWQISRKCTFKISGVRTSWDSIKLYKNELEKWTSSSDTINNN